MRQPVHPLSLARRLSPGPALRAGLMALALAAAPGCAADMASSGGSLGSQGSTTKETSADTSTGSANQGSGGGGAADAGSFGSSDASAPPIDQGSGSPSGGAADNGGALPGNSGSGEAGGGKPDPGLPDNGGTSGPDAGSSDDAGASADNDASAPVCNTKDPVKLYLSADDSNSMAGATVARGLISAGQVVFKAVRTYEMLNYYTFDPPAAKPGEVALSAQLHTIPGKDGASSGDYALQIAVRAPDFDAASRRRLNIVLAVDTSSSMGWGTPGEQGIDLGRAACKALVASLEAGDRFALLAWGDGVQTVVPATDLKGKDDGKLAAACESLQAKGITGLSAGLLAAYDVVGKGFDAAKINRVVLLSDGGANVGETDKDTIAKAAKGADGKSIYLMGVGVGDPWNYNDGLMNAVTDAGKGAYVFLDSAVEAWSVFGSQLLRHVEIAARDVQVAVELPPSFEVSAFHGEQISTNKDEVDPQHLAANDAMIFHQELHSCAPESLGVSAKFVITATYQDPLSGAAKSQTFEATLTELLASDTKLLQKGDAVVAYAEALQDVQALDGKAAQARIDDALATVGKGAAALPADADLQELIALLQEYRKVFDKGPVDAWPTGGTGANPIAVDCKACKATGNSLDAMRCALELCDDSVYLGSTYGSPTQSKTDGTFAAVSHFGDAGNHLAPKVGGSYALMATGPALGTDHSADLGGTSMTDPFSKGGAAIYNAIEWKVTLKAPAGANGIRFRHVFFSQEYDEYVGSTFNDKFYVVIAAGSTNGGSPTVINYTDCRDPNQHYDFVCSPGMQFCNPRARYCYIAINTAASECCWLGGCPNGKAKTNISGTGYSCAASQGSDSASTGSSTGWMVTEWPVEPGETFTLTFHLHDTGDGVYDSEVLLDGLEFVGSVTPGTWPLVSEM